MADEAAEKKPDSATPAVDPTKPKPIGPVPNGGGHGGNPPPPNT